MILISGCLIGLNCKYNGCNNYSEQHAMLAAKRKAVPVCPEQMGGLTTPRNPAEIIGGSGQDVLAGRARVVDCTGRDVTDAFVAGAHEVLKIARLIGADKAIFKEGSPSCGSMLIYDGSFQGRKKHGMGVVSALLRQHGINIIPE